MILPPIVSVFLFHSELFINSVRFGFRIFRASNGRRGLSATRQRIHIVERAQAKLTEFYQRKGGTLRNTIFKIADE